MTLGGKLFTILYVYSLGISSWTRSSSLDIGNGSVALAAGRMGRDGSRIAPDLQ